MKSREYPLIIEDHPEDYDGYPFITVIYYHNIYYMTVIDNFDKVVGAYVLDLCPVEGISEEEFINYVVDWWYNDKKRPLSFYLADKGVIDKFQKIYRRFNIDYIIRVIGPITNFNLNRKHTIQRKKAKKWIRKDENTPANK